MNSLPLALDIADAAIGSPAPLDIAETAAALAHAHPESHYSEEEVAEALKAVVEDERAENEG